MGEKPSASIRFHNALSSPLALDHAISLAKGGGAALCSVMQLLDLERAVTKAKFGEGE